MFQKKQVIFVLQIIAHPQNWSIFSKLQTYRVGHCNQTLSIGRALGNIVRIGGRSPHTRHHVRLWVRKRDLQYHEAERRIRILSRPSVLHLGFYDSQLSKHIDRRGSCHTIGI